VPVAILLVVAAAQVLLVHTVDLSPWKGGGFGMFAAVDGGAVRSVRIRVDAPGRSEMVHVPASLEVDADRAAALPVTWLLDRLGRAVATREQRRSQPVDRVTIEVWTAALSADGSQADARRLAQYILEVAAVR
jgi:hypothetical protein